MRPPPISNHLTETPKLFVNALYSRLNPYFTRLDFPRSVGSLSRTVAGNQAYRFLDTHLIQTPHYQGQFALSLGKESPYIFSKFNPLNPFTAGVLDGGLLR